MQIRDHLDQKNLHHAYLIEGEKESVVPEIFGFFENLGIKTVGNPDFIYMAMDSLKVENARNLKAMTGEKQFSEVKKVFVIFANSFPLEAQNSLLKVFEEPAENTHFFLVTPDTGSLIPTLVSRFYFIKRKRINDSIVGEATKFLKMNPHERIDFLKGFIAEIKEEDGKENASDKSLRADSLKLLNSIESAIYEKISKDRSVLTNNVSFFEQIFKAREFIRQPGSSVKSLLESVALTMPIF